MNKYSHIEKGFTEYDNWRYMKNVIIRPPITEYPTEIYRSREKRLLVLLGNYYSVSFPGMTILEYINYGGERKGVVMAVEGRYLEYCKECYGAGKFDWVSNVTGPNHIHSRYEFIRDKNYVLLYHKPNGKISKNNIWAPTEVHEGERICDTCLGTGIHFDSYQLLGDMQNSLILHDIRCLLK